MKIRYFSDLHLEMVKTKGMERHVMDRLFRLIPPGSDEVCILAGDIGYPQSINYDNFMDFVSSNFKKTFVIPGNHEYYGRPMIDTNNFMKSYFDKFHNITLLNNTWEIYADHCFIGTTLWSQVTDPKFKINDMYSIPGLDVGGYNQLNKESIAFLEDALDHENCIVVTHHLPSLSLIDEKYLSVAMRPYNQWFACDLDELILTKKKRINAWFYGHTHMPSSTRIHGIPFLCNSIGYPGENTKLDFGKNLII
jgi:predicted phosphohydrolase